MNYNLAKDFLTQKVRRDFLIGKINGTPTIPSHNDVEQEVTRIIESSENGILGTMKDVVKGSISDPSGYSQNVINAKDNIEVLMGGISKEINSVIDQINNSTVEKNNAIREMRKMSTSFDEIDSGQLTDSGLSYSINDSFNDVEKIDLERTTADVHLNAGRVSLSQTNSGRIQFQHYLNQSATTFVIEKGRSKVVKEEQAPASKFGAMFSKDDTDRWEYIVTTSDAVNLTGYFNLKLSPIGDPVSINHITIKLGSSYNADIDGINGVIRLQYMDIAKDSGGWKDVPGGASEVSTSEISFNFMIPETTHIRIVFEKHWPDIVSTKQYIFSVTELIVKKAETSYESVLMSRSLSVTPYRKETPSIHSVMLKSKESNTAGTSIDYFVGIDKPVAGKIVNSASGTVEIDSDDAYAFVSNGLNAENRNENYYIYASQLRDRPWISGAAIYSNWQPKWQQIKPLSDQNSSIPNIRFFNTTKVDRDVHDISYADDIRWGDPRYTGPWPASVEDSWADNWDGTPGGMPESGFIWGEDPFTYAGIWWGDGIEYPGWWRPNVPTASGGQTWNTDNKYSFPDYYSTSYNKDGMLAGQKRFYKVFKWPANFTPIPGSVKLSVSNGDSNNSTTLFLNNKHAWKWNTRGVQTLKTTEPRNFNIKEDTYYYTFDMIKEGVAPVGALPIIVKDSITNVQFINFSPADIETFNIEYGVKYEQVIVNEGQENETVENVRTEIEDKDEANRTFTILIPEYVNNYYKLTGSKTPEISLQFQYTLNEEIEASWETFLFVPENAPQGSAKIKINDTRGDAINKIELLDLDTFGIMEGKQEVIKNSYQDQLTTMNLNYGWNKVRVFVDVDLSTTVNDGSNSLWDPNYNMVETLDGDLIGNRTNSYAGSGGKIVDNDIDFIASGVVPNMAIHLNPTTTTDPVMPRGIISEVTKHTLKVININTYASHITGVINVDDTYKIQNYKIPKANVTTSFLYYSAQISSFKNSMNEVDIHTLINETNVDDDSRFAIVDDVDGTQYLVVKEPYNLTFPENIVNNLHYTRTYFGNTAVDVSGYITFTTGSSGNIAGHPNPIYDTADSGVSPDLSNRHRNTLTDQHYNNISTYGEKIQVTDGGKEGFLFWNTAENLQTYYSIKYALPVNNRPSERIFVMSRFISDTPEVTPSLEHYSLIVNGNEKDFGR